METSEALPLYPRSHVRWPILYRGEDFIAEGTMVDLSAKGGRFAGTMPVAVGMRLGLFIDPPQKRADLIIEEAVVTWSNANHFGAVFIKLRTDDMEWLRGYLEIDERRDSARHFAELSSAPSQAGGCASGNAAEG